MGQTQQIILNNPKPTIGRIVHYVLPASSVCGGQHRPAIITHVSTRVCSLCVFKGSSSDFQHNRTGFATTDCFAGSDSGSASASVGGVLEDNDGAPGTWHWPELEAVEVQVATQGKHLIGRLRSDGTVEKVEHIAGIDLGRDPEPARSRPSVADAEIEEQRMANESPASL